MEIERVAMDLGNARLEDIGAFVLHPNFDPNVTREEPNQRDSAVTPSLSLSACLSPPWQRI